MAIQSNKAHTLDEVEKIIRQQEYKYCCLMNKDGKSIVPYNSPKSKKSVLNKFAEIRKRWTVLPDDVYYVWCKNTLNGNVKSDEYPVIKGKASLEDAKQHQVIPVIQQLGDPSKVMTYQEALRYVQENEQLKGQVNFWQQSYNKLKQEYDELEKDYNEIVDKPMSEKNPIQEWADNTIPQIIPVLDRYFDIQERKLKLQEVQQYGKFMREGIIKSANRNGKQIPQPGTEEFERYLDKLERMNDEEFKAETDFLYKNYPEIYAVVYDAFREDEPHNPNNNVQNK